ERGRGRRARGTAGACETRVAGTASDPAVNRCSSTGATHRRFAWSSTIPPCPARAGPERAAPRRSAAARLDPEGAHDLPGAGQEWHRDQAADEAAEVEAGEEGGGGGARGGRR